MCPSRRPGETRRQPAVLGRDYRGGLDLIEPVFLDMEMVLCVVVGLLYVCATVRAKLTTIG